MFNTGLFVLEVQKRPCLWNLKDRLHNDRHVKLQAWEQIATVFKTCNDSYCHNNITIDLLQRKWKHLRDYYIREKKRTSKAGNSSKNNGTNSTGGRKKNSPLLDMLQFLDTDRGRDIVQINIERNEAEENFYPEINEEGSISENENAQPVVVHKIKVQQSIENPLAEDDDSADEQFLNSLLPIIKNMSTNERLKFQAQMLNPTPTDNAIDEEERMRNPETRKRPRITRKTEDTEVVNKETNSDAIRKRDEFSIYGEYVANKLRNIRNKHARHTAEFHINSVLYKAEMGEYDNVSRDVNTTKSVARDSSNAVIRESIMYEEDSNDIIADVIKTEDLD